MDESTTPFAKPMPGLGLVVAAGGGGARFGGDKLLVPLAGAPVLAHCLRALAPLCPAGHVVVVCPGDKLCHYRDAAARHAPGVKARFVVGGAVRAESVLAGLDALPPEASVAAIHDAARPLATADLLARCVASCHAHGSGVAARRATDTVKEATPDGEVLRTHDRSRIWLMETPQVFPRAALAAAYRAALAAGAPPTDDAGAVERAGGSVRLVDSLSPNLKITFPWDVLVAAAMMSHGLEGAPHE